MDDLNRSHYSVFQNIYYCLENTARCYFPLLCWMIIAILVNVILPVLSTYLPKAVIEKLSGGGSIWEVVRVILGFTGCIALLSGIDKFFEKFIYHQKYRMNTFYLKQVTRKGLTTDYSNQENGVFRKLQTESFASCNGNYSPLTSIYDVLIQLCTSVLGLSVFWAILAKLNVFVILFLIVTTVISYFLNQKIMKWTEKHNCERIGYEQKLNYINMTSGDLRYAKDIRMYRMSAWLSELYRENMNGIIGWYRRLAGKLFGVAVGDSSLSLLREGITYVYLISLIGKRQITVADFILYFGVVTGFSVWLGSIFSQVSLLKQLNLKINYFRSYLEFPEIFQRENGKNPSDGLPRVIELKNVSYQYEGAGQFALHNINLRIAPGEHLAVVGLNGAGKTTLVKLICGLIDPTDGQVLYDGVDVREYNRMEFYKLFAAVFQQFSILPVTVEEIVAGTPAPDLDRDRVEECLKTVGLWEKIELLSQGVESPFGKTIYDDGVEFSGGEVQKLLLARALYKAAPVMLLDEPTAALDPIAESNLYENYNQISEGKTTVFVSHRLASTSFCSRIILIENGEICEMGTHDSLLGQKGKYYHLFETQANYYRKKPKEAEVAE